MSGTLTIQAATSAYLRERRMRGELSAASEAGYRARLDVFAQAVGADRDASKLKRRHVERWMDTLGRYAPSSRRSYFVAVRLFCRWLRDQGIVSGDLFDGVRPPREPRTVPRNLTPEDVAKVLAACDERERVVAVLMLQLGLRRGEVARLCVEDLDLTNRVVLIHGKGDHEAVLPMPEQVVRDLRYWLGTHRITSGAVIRSRTCSDRGLRPATVGEMLTRAMYRAGVKACGWDRVSGHSLRHTAAADMLRHGAHVRDVQAVLRHTSIATTQRYMPLVVHTLEGAVNGRTY